MRNLLLAAVVGVSICGVRAGARVDAAADAGAGEALTLEDRLAAVVDRRTLGQFWGVVIVKVGDEVVLERGYGYATRELDRVSPMESLFDIGSIAKSFTAAAALSLAEEGLLDLDAPVSEVLGRDLGRAGRATTRELLGHVGGVGSLRVDFRGADLETREGLLDAVARAMGPDDGGAFVYSNVGYFLVAAVIEEVGGKAFEEVVRFRTIDDLNMREDPHNPFAPSRLRPTGFVSDGEVWGGRATARMSSRAPSSDTFGYPWNWGHRGATGVVTSGHGLLAWMNAVVEGAHAMPDPMRMLLDDPPLVREAPIMLTPGKGGYGLGWYVEVDDAGEVVRFGHGGATGGYRSAAWHYPRGAGGLGMTIVVLTNEAHDADGMERALARVLGTMSPRPRKPMRGGVFLLRYPDEDGDGLVRVEDGLAWHAMAWYRGRGENGEVVVEDRPTLILRDSLRSMWSVMVHMDTADALDLAGRVAAAMDAAGPVAGEARAIAGLAVEFDVRGRTLGEARSVVVDEGLGFEVVGAAGGGGGVVLRLGDGAGVLATVRMGRREAGVLADRLRGAAE